MKKLLMMLLMAVVSQAAFAQHVKEVTFDSFNKVNLQGVMDVEIKQGNTNKITVEALNGADMGDLSIDLSGNELSVKTKVLKQLTDHENNRRESDWQKRFKIEIIYNATLTDVSAGRGANVNCQNVLKGNRLKIDASSGAILTVEVNTNSLELASIQGAEVKISGIAGFQSTKVNTGGQLEAYDLVSEEAEIKANTGGEAKIKVTKYINASAGTGGSIHYTGQPTQRSVHTSLGGEVQSN